MAVIGIKTFGGEYPSVSARLLPPGSAAVARNILAQTNEFRPLKTDLVVASSTSGNKTLYRMARDVSGDYTDNPALNWISNSAVVNYVRGQNDDDRTERTYYSYQDGLQAPLVMTVDGATRTLGIPAPSKPVCVVGAGNEFTRVESTNWVDTTVVPQLKTAVENSLHAFDDTARQNGNVPVAGPYSYVDRGYTWGALNAGGGNDSWNLRYVVGGADAAKAAGLADPLLQPEFISSGTQVQLRLTALPAWAVCDTVSLKASLLAVLHPRTGGALMSDGLATTITNRVQTIFDPSGELLKPSRDRLEAVLTEFKDLIGYSLTGVPAVPTEPVRPSTPEIVYDIDGNASYSTAAEWVTYRADLAAYKADSGSYATSKTTFEAERGSRISRMADLQAEAARITKDVETQWIVLYQNIEAAVKQYIDQRDLDFNEDDSLTNVVAVDADRIMEDRFYVTTFVNDWGEESAPSPVSDLLEVSQYQSVTISKPAVVPSGFGIVGWRLYRTNQGASSANFQLVADDTAPIAHNTNGAFDYFQTVTAETGYVDAKKGSELQETLTTTEWLTPPTNVIGGTTHYLAGFTALPNGIMAGFLDNTVCFCEPYAPYAWPISYQLTVHSPIVGMAAFGQTLVVCTRGSPYIANGSDSASMNLQELPGNQACVSARSMVSVENGVLYASPDGICLAGLNGVQVVTQGLFTREDWQALSPSTIIAVLHDTCYYFVAGTTMYALDFVAKKLIEVVLSGTPTALYSDRNTDTLYALIGGNITALFSGTGHKTGVYRTGIIQMPKPLPMAWLQVDSDYTSSVVVRWYGDGSVTPRYTATLSSITPVRLPSGCYLEHEVEIETSARVTSVVLAGSTSELQSA